MSHYDIFAKVKTKVSGLVDIAELYTHMHLWLNEEYKYDIVEKKYDEKSKPGGKKYEIVWSCDREIDMYSKFLITVEWDIRSVKDVEVERGGEKVKIQWCKLKVITSAMLVTDYESRWKERPFFKFLQGFYEKYLYKNTIDRLRDQLWDEGWAFVNELKAFLNLYKYTVETKPPEAAG